ncbi:MAG: oxidoreductase [Chitinophagales bacterium]
MKQRKALVAGGTGLVGGELIKHLLEDSSYSEVYALTRRLTGIVHPKLTETVIDFENLAKINIAPVDDVFCALGTTMKKAGSKEAFARVDYYYVVELAKAAKRCGGSQFLVVSSLMANPRSSNFYLRVKGEMEEAVKDKGPETVLIFRPSNLVGERQESRPGEKIGQAVIQFISPLLLGGFKKYRNINANTVASAMIATARAELNTKRVFESNGIAAFIGSSD